MMAGNNKGATRSWGAPMFAWRHNENSNGPNYRLLPHARQGRNMKALVPRRRGGHLLLWLVALVLLPSAFAGLFWSKRKKAAATATSGATFTLFDNGASQGGVDVTLTKEEFDEILKGDGAESNASDADDSVPPSEQFAVAMSSKIEVSKYMAEKPVIATKAFREDGEMITTFDQLMPANDDSAHQRRIYLVAEGLEFVWPFVELGHNQTISPNVVPPTPNAGPVVLESFSESPRVFRVYNMASEEEASAIVSNALNATGDKALKRSTVGSGTDAEGNDLKREDFGRTSDNTWDHESPEAKVMITRSFQLTNIVEDAGKRDGLQVVRYHPGQGYNTHPDFFTPKDGHENDFDFNPYSGGSNRFATVFMYLNDPEEGGCTVFPRAPAAGPAMEMPPEAKDMFKKGTWEHTVNEDCYSKLAVPPKLGTAALFYSVTPDGRIDPQSHHAACPLIKGIKWGANIWIWNKQRFGEIRTGEKRMVIMKNSADETVYISWEGKASGVIEPGQSMNMNSFEYHRFKASFGSHTEKAFDTFTVQSEGDPQKWEMKRPRRQQQQQQDSSGVHAGVVIATKNLMDDVLYFSWEGNPVATIGPGESSNFNSFPGHVMSAYLGDYGGEYVTNYKAQTVPKHQVWDISRKDDDDDEKAKSEHEEL